MTFCGSPVYVGYLGTIFGKISKCESSQWVQDIWPEALITSLNLKKKNILQAESYIKGGIYLSNGKEKQAVEIYEEIIKSENKFYSILALNSILEKNLLPNKVTIVSSSLPPGLSYLVV